MPVSDPYLRAQHQQQVRAETSQWFDHGAQVGYASGGVHSEQNPAAYLRAHGYIATNAAGEEVVPSPAQARGLVSRILNGLNQQANRSGTTGYSSTSVSFRDDNRPPKDAVVHARRAF